VLEKSLTCTDVFSGRILITNNFILFLLSSLIFLVCLINFFIQFLKKFIYFIMIYFLIKYNLKIIILHIWTNILNKIIDET
jgi:hypothetical protein